MVNNGLIALGVFCGIFMLVFMLGMRSELQYAIFLDFGNHARNLMYVFATETSMPYVGFQPGRTPRLNLDDIEYLHEKVDGVDYIAPRTNKWGNITKGEITENYEIR